MDDYIRLEIRTISAAGRQVATYNVNIRPGWAITWLKSYIKDYLGLEKGNLYMNQNNIDFKKGSLSELGMRNGTVLQMKRSTKKTIQMQSCTVLVSPGNSHQLLIPVNCTVEFLKFIVECQEKIRIEQQRLECSHKKWENTSAHKISLEELTELKISNRSVPLSCPSVHMDLASSPPPHHFTRPPTEQETTQPEKEDPLPPNPRMVFTKNKPPAIPKDQCAYLSPNNNEPSPYTVGSKKSSYMVQKP